MKQKMIVTPFAVVSMIISYDNSRIVALLKKSEFVSYVQGYCLHDFDLEFEEKYGQDNSGNCIKMQDIEQCPNGNYFAVTYQENGLFRLRTFGKNNRSAAEIEDDELKISETLGL